MRNPLTCLRLTDRTNPSISDQWMDGRAQMGHWVSRITKIHTHPPSPKKYIYNHKNPQNFDLQQSNIDLHVASHRIKKSQKQKRLQICLDPFFFWAYQIYLELESRDLQIYLELRIVSISALSKWFLGLRFDIVSCSEPSWKVKRRRCRQGWLQKVQRERERERERGNGENKTDNKS